MTTEDLWLKLSQAKNYLGVERNDDSLSDTQFKVNENADSLRRELFIEYINTHGLFDSLYTQVMLDANAKWREKAETNPVYFLLDSPKNAQLDIKYPEIKICLFDGGTRPTIKIYMPMKDYWEMSQLFMNK